MFDEEPTRLHGQCWEHYKLMRQLRDTWVEHRDREGDRLARAKLAQQEGRLSELCSHILATQTIPDHKLLELARRMGILDGKDKLPG